MPATGYPHADHGRPPNLGVMPPAWASVMPCHWTWGSERPEPVDLRQSPPQCPGPGCPGRGARERQIALPVGVADSGLPPEQGVRQTYGWAVSPRVVPPNVGGWKPPALRPPNGICLGMPPNFLGGESGSIRGPTADRASECPPDFGGAKTPVGRSGRGSGPCHASKLGVRRLDRVDPPRLLASSCLGLGDENPTAMLNAAGGVRAPGIWGPKNDGMCRKPVAAVGHDPAPEPGGHEGCDMSGENIPPDHRAPSHGHGLPPDLGFGNKRTPLAAPACLRAARGSGNIGERADTFHLHWRCRPGLRVHLGPAPSHRTEGRFQRPPSRRRLAPAAGPGLFGPSRRQIRKDGGQQKLLPA